MFEHLIFKSQNQYFFIQTPLDHLTILSNTTFLFVNDIYDSLGKNIIPIFVNQNNSGEVDLKGWCLWRM